jgi:trans-2,3-dihydro-3-hydroxyanthranilate isomerase
MPLPVTWLDVFSAEPFTGNQLAVVHDADGVDDATMLAFARETRLSETTFVQAPRAGGADYRNRIWWSKGEMAFAGHPSLGTAVAVAARRGERATRYVQETPAGLQPIEVELDPDGRRARASMLQEPAVHGELLEPAAVAAVAGLEPDDLDPALPPQVVGTGMAQVLLPVRDAAVLQRCAPRLDGLRTLLRPRECATLYVVHAEPALGFARARAFFDDLWGVSEDPATGSAVGPLCAYLQTRAGAERVIVDQGVELGRPSRLEAQVEGERIRVAGDAVIVMTGELHV